MMIGCQYGSIPISVVSGIASLYSLQIPSICGTVLAVGMTIKLEGAPVERAGAALTDCLVVDCVPWGTYPPVKRAAKLMIRMGKRETALDIAHPKAKNIEPFTKRRLSRLLALPQAKTGLD